MSLKLPGWPIEGGPEAHPVTRTSQEHVDFGESPAIDFARTPDGGGTGPDDFTVAQFPGTVTTATYVGGEYGPGWIVEYTGTVLDEDGVEHEVRVGHCHHSGPLLVSLGDSVEEGTRLGQVGWSGWCIPAGPAGCHDHMKLYVDGERVDPEEYLDRGSL